MWQQATVSIIEIKVLFMVALSSPFNQVFVIFQQVAKYVTHLNILHGQNSFPEKGILLLIRLIVKKR